MFFQDWGIPGDIHNLQLKWHVPDEEENKFAAELLERFLIGELDRLKSHREGAATLERWAISRTSCLEPQQTQDSCVEFKKLCLRS